MSDRVTVVSFQDKFFLTDNTEGNRILYADSSKRSVEVPARHIKFLVKRTEPPFVTVVPHEVQSYADLVGCLMAPPKYPVTGVNFRRATFHSYYDITTEIRSEIDQNEFRRLSLFLLNNGHVSFKSYITVIYSGFSLSLDAYIMLYLYPREFAAFMRLVL
jgi:hypothetical protein